MELTLSSLALRAQTRARPRAEEVAAEKVAVMQEVKTKLSECGGLAQFVGCANALHTVLDGSVDAATYAKILAGYTPQETLALGAALRDLGHLLEAGRATASTRQSVLAHRARKMALKQQMDLEGKQRENEALRETIKSARAHVEQLEQSLSFLSDFPLPKGVKPAVSPFNPPGAPRMMQLERARFELATAEQIRDDAEAFAERAKARRATRAERAEESLVQREELSERAAAQKAEEHEAKLARLKVQKEELRRVREAEVATRDEVRRQIARDAGLRLREAREKAREALARAEAEEARTSTAVEALEQAQAQCKSCQRELAHSRMALQREQARPPLPR